MASTWKGKGREDGMVPEELNPVITYRHLLSSGLGVRNPLRVCGLSDMDAFYAACEQKRLCLEPSIPLVVRQWDALIAVNYPARTFKISRMDKISSALQRCPHLRVVHVATFDPSVPDAKPTYMDNPNSETHKISLDYYRKESKKIMDVFKEMLPGAEVERASIDEAFIDFTEPVRQQILAHFPHLATPPPEGIDTPLPPPPPKGVPLAYPPARSATQGPENIWDGLGILVPISGKPSEEPASNVDITPPSVEGRYTSPMFSGDINRANNEEGPSTRTLLAPSGHSRSAELEDALLADEEDQRSVSDDEEYLPTDGVHNSSGDEDLPPTWHDVALSIAASLMLKMRDEVKRRLGYTTSAGIARNKFLAKVGRKNYYQILLIKNCVSLRWQFRKLVASYKKRDSQTILRNAAIPNYLRPLAFQKIRFLGGKLGNALAEAYKAQTVGDLLGISIEQMQRKFGESSIWVWEILRGIDRSEVKEKPAVTKSMGASKNLQHAITHPSEGVHWLRILAGELAFRLQEAREENPGLWPKTLVLHIRQSYETTRSKQAPFPFTRTANMDFICKAGEKLWVELVGTSAEYDKNKAKGRSTGMKITNVFLGFTGIETMTAGQRSIDGFFVGHDRPIKRKARDDEEGAPGESPQKHRTLAAGAIEDSPKKPMALATDISFRCARCRKQIWRTAGDADDGEVALSILKMEHDDFHFAQDLAKERDENESHVLNRGGEPKKKTKKSKVEVKGIAKFFSPAASKK